MGPVRMCGEGGQTTQAPNLTPPFPSLGFWVLSRLRSPTFGRAGSWSSTPAAATTTTTAPTSQFLLPAGSPAFSTPTGLTHPWQLGSPAPTAAGRLAAPTPAATAASRCRWTSASAASTASRRSL